MPTRLLSDDILTCERVDALSPTAEVFYRRLFSVVDDFGRFDGRLPILRARLFPLRPDAATLDEVDGWLAECQAAGLVTVYCVDSKPYLVLHGVGRPRAKTSQFPDPPGAAPVPYWDDHRVARLVYFIHDPVSEAVKIGSAVCPESRLRDLQTSNPNPLILLGTRDGGQAEEKRLHREFAPARRRGEWFGIFGPLADFLRAEGLLS